MINYRKNEKLMKIGNVKDKKNKRIFKCVHVSVGRRRKII
jgi:hypothetical protein